MSKLMRSKSKKNNNNNEEGNKEDNKENNKENNKEVNEVAHLKEKQEKKVMKEQDEIEMKAEK